MRFGLTAIQVWCHSEVRKAIADGRLVPQRCECGSDKRARAHHDDYSKPLDVRWLCVSCHNRWHHTHTPLNIEAAPPPRARPARDRSIEVEYVWTGSEYKVRRKRRRVSPLTPRLGR